MPGPLAVPPPGHDLLVGKVVVLTAAAGTGIGGAAARRCLDEGASLALSDAHAARLAAGSRWSCCSWTTLGITPARYEKT